MTRRTELTRQVIKEQYFLSKYPSLIEKMPSGWHSNIWWWDNPTNPNSLRLSARACNLLHEDYDEKFYRFDLPQQILPKTLIQLERHFEDPYYIPALRKQAIYICGEREVVMLALHENNLQRYLDSYSE